MTSKITKQIAEIARLGAELQKDLDKVVAQVKRMEPGEERDQTITYLVRELRLDPSVFAPTTERARANWSAERWLEEAVGLSSAAKDWSRAGRFDKASECEKAARDAQQMATKLRATRNAGQQ